MIRMLLNSLVVSALFIGGTVISAASAYQGIYRGAVSLSENYEYYGFEGIFVGHIDSKSQATLWIGNDEEAYKVSFKVNSSGQGKFTAAGITVSVSFNPDGSIVASTNTDRYLSFDSIKIPITDRPVTQQLHRSLRSNLTSAITLNFPSEYEPIDFDSETLKDQFLLLSGVWQIKSLKANVGGIRMTMTGDMIILPDSVYTYGKAKGRQILIQQDPFTMDYESIRLSSVTFDWPKKRISAQASGYLQGYYSTIDYTVDQKTSYYDSDGDGLSNHAEITETFTNPFMADTDGDKVGDADELSAGTNPLNRLEFPVKLSIAISTAKGNAQIPSMATVAVNGVNHDVPLTKGKGTKVLSLPSGKSYEISASATNWTSGAPQQISLKKTTTLRIQLKATP